MIDIARPGDLEDILTLAREFYAHFGLAWIEDAKAAVILEVLGHPECGRIWLARDRDDQPVGYALVVTYLSLELGGRTAILDEFHVTATQRGRGIGRALLETLSQALAREGVGHLRLELDEHHPEAATLYQRQGFLRDGRELWTRRLRD